jgi:hypothetical protein
MSDVPSNLIPTRVTQLPLAPVADENSLMMIVYQGNNYQIRVGDLLSVAGVPTSRQVIAGTGMTGGGQLSSNVTLSIANGGVGTVQLASSGVTPGTYGSTTSVPVFTVDSTGRVTAASTASISLSGFVPTTREVIAGTGLNGGGALNNNVTLNANLSSATPEPGFQNGAAGVSTDIARADHKHPAVDLADDDQVDNILRINNGGTGRSLTMQPGAMVWSGADGLYVGPAGNLGQVLVSGGNGAPTWGSTLILSPVPANLMFAGPVSGSDADPVFRTMVNADLPDSGVTPNTYGSGSLTPVLVVNGKGVVTGASTTAVTPAWSNVTGTPTTVAGYGITDAVTLTGTQSVTNKTIDASLNTLSNIPNNALNNSSLTIGGTNVALGATATTLTGLTSIAVTQDPTSALQLATKQYVDAVAEGLHIHASCAAATPASLASITGGTVTYNNGTSGVGATLTLSAALTVLDGYTLLNGDRVLVKDEATQANNGIYTWATGGTVLTRATDFDTAVEIAGGDFTFVTNGTLYADTGWVQIDDVVTVGTNPVVWVQFSGAGTYTAGTGLTLSGSQFSITNTGTAGTYGSASQVPVFVTNAQGQVTSVTNTAIAINGAAVSGDIAGSAGSVANALTAGTYLTSTGTYNGSTARTFAVDATDANTVSKVVARDASGNFSAGIITAALNGNANTATNLAGGAASQIPYQTGAGTTAFIANGTAGQVLTSAGAGVPVWSGISGGTF